MVGAKWTLGIRSQVRKRRNVELNQFLKYICTPLSATLDPVFFVFLQINSKKTRQKEYWRGGAFVFAFP
jgi:hypothetical protein